MTAEDRSVGAGLLLGASLLVWKSGSWFTGRSEASKSVVAMSSKDGSSDRRESEGVSLLRSEAGWIGD